MPQGLTPGTDCRRQRSRCEDINHDPIPRLRQPRNEDGP
jgi:hypothetical protein